MTALNLRPLAYQRPF